MTSLPKKWKRTAGFVLLVGLLPAFLSAGAGAQPVIEQDTAPAGSAHRVLAPSNMLISYQGTLTDQNGDPVNATVSMKFALYDASSDGNLIWGPEPQTVQVANGLFNVLLGSVVPLNSANFTGDLWLDIKVNDEHLIPRELLTSVVYAVEASRLSAGNVTIRGSLGFADLNGTWYTDNWIGMINTLGDNRKWLHIGGITDDDGIRRLAYFAARHYFAGNVGIGVMEPSAQLDISGNLRVSENVSGPANIFGNGSQQIHMPPGNGSIYFNWHQGANAHFGGGDAVVDVSIKSDGIDMHGNGVYNCGALTEANLQTPEELAADGIDRFEGGDVLCWSPKAQRLEKCSTPSEPLVQAVADKNGRPIVIGAEAIKVIGPVRAGDYLVASSVPGYAMASAAPSFGTVIAQALEDFDGEQGVIKAMIRKM